MNCRTCQDKLDAALAGTLPPEDARQVDDHLAGCLRCRLAASRAEQLLENVNTAARTPPSGGARQRLTDALHDEIAETAAHQPAPRRARLTPQMAVALTAVVLVLCVLLGGTVARSRRRVPTPVSGWTQPGITPFRGAAGDYPVITAELVLAFEEDAEHRHLVALDRRTGVPRWRSAISVGGAVLCADTRRAYAQRTHGPRKGHVVAWDLAIGRLEWETPEATPDPGAVGLVSVGDALVWVAGCTLQAVASATGRPLWATEIETPTALSPPVTDGDAVYVASADTAAKVAASDGTILWQHRLPPQAGPVLHAPLLACGRGRITVSAPGLAGQTHIRTLDTTDGRPLWERELPSPPTAIIAARHIHVRAGTILALDRDTGRLAWKTDIDGSGPLALEGQTLYALTDDGGPCLVVLDTDTGNVRRTRRLPSPPTGLVVLQGTAFLSTHGGRLHALPLGALDLPGTAAR